MKVIILSPLKAVFPHYETELEIAQRHLDMGDQVQMVSCFGELGACDFNHSGELTECQRCRGHRQMGMELLSQRIKSSPFPENRAADLECDTLLPNIQTPQELSELMYDNFDVGYGVLSSLVSVTKDPEPILDQHRDLMAQFYEAAIHVYKSTIDTIQHEQPDRIYVFNGRFAQVRAVLRACELMETDCYIHERGCNQDKFQIFKNTFPHNISYLQNRMAELWENADPQTRHQAAEQFYKDRVNGVDGAWLSFTKEQKAEKLPDNWDESKRNFALFTSSENEFVAIGDQWKNTYYTTQVDGLGQMIADLPNIDPKIHIYVRVHPNLRNVTNQSMVDLMKLRSPQITLIGPDEQVDTYHLMRSCEKTISFGSTVGIEATYWGKPSILIGSCFYKGMGSAHEPNNHAHFMELLSQTMTPASKIGALIYGYWNQTNGIDFKYCQPDDLFQGSFRGQIIHQRKSSLKRRLKTTVRQLFGKLQKPKPVLVSEIGSGNTQFLKAG